MLNIFNLPEDCFIIWFGLYKVTCNNRVHVVGWGFVSTKKLSTYSLLHDWIHLYLVAWHS